VKLLTRIALVALLALPLAGCGSSGTVAKTVTVTATSYQFVPTTVTASPPAAPAPTGPRSTIAGTGTFLVGSDVIPGTYRSSGSASRDCYWERLSGLGGTMGDIIANGSSSGPLVVTIEPTDKAFTSSHCTPWTMVEG
jgi:hypothetical protein